MQNLSGRPTLFIRASILALPITIALLTNSAKALDDSERLKPLIADAKKWAADAAIIAAVKAENAAPKHQDMTQEKWKDISAIDPFVQDLAKNSAAEVIRTKGHGRISEGFVNAADGHKVCLLAKTTSWSHKGKDKHQKPMAGQIWIGKLEQDESTGLEQIQFAVPVLDGGKPIGSMVIGVSSNKLNSATAH